jgi:hypothetical protein
MGGNAMKKLYLCISDVVFAGITHRAADFFVAESTQEAKLKADAYQKSLRPHLHVLVSYTEVHKVPMSLMIEVVKGESADEPSTSTLA